ncbi:AEC family transporter [Sinimarinibacterium sp. CAU 1509]|uniref:AEC family transporter n=1 Tax=Sinimarinibacterium sp. CAU 1509 TaxID=2562283 RepID=UPI001B7FB188|nr:AEC family transporter [Sinimarinibacterium sp. CAU 1509]
MTALFLLLVCLALGVLIARFAHPPLGLAQGLNWWVINIALPALVLELIPRLHFEWQFWFLVVTQYMVMIGALLIFDPLGRRLGWSRARIGAVILVCGLGNTSFMGYPLLEALRGREGLALGVIADQVGCFIALAVGGVLVSSIYSGATPHPKDIARRVLLFPAFLALVTGVIVGMLGGWPSQIDEILQRLGATLTPLALFSVGLRFKLHLGGGQMQPLLLGLSWKLLVAPLLALLLGWATGVGGLTLTIGVMQTAMAPMISAAILADQHNLDPPLANTILGAGILLSVVTVPLWSLMLG